MSMSASFSKLNVLLAKTQASLGTHQTGLDSSSFVTVDDNFTMDFKQEFTEPNLAQGIFGQPQSVAGTQSVDVKVTLPVIPTGSTTPANVDAFLTCSGLSKGLVGNAFTYSPSSAYQTDWKDMTLWSYSGDHTNTNSLLTKTHSVMFDCKISGELGKPCTFEFTGKGPSDGTPTGASYVSGTLPLFVLDHPRCHQGNDNDRRRVKSPYLEIQC